jgi:hypothetical protein
VAAVVCRSAARRVFLMVGCAARGCTATPVVGVDRGHADMADGAAQGPAEQHGV